MDIGRGLASRCIGAALLLCGAIVLGGNGVDLTVTNDGINDIFITITDMSITPPLTAVNHQRINGFTSIPISVSADASGRGNISWTAITVDAHDQQCGHATSTGLVEGGSVNAHVDSDCASR